MYKAHLVLGAGCSVLSNVEEELVEGCKVPSQKIFEI